MRRCILVLLTSIAFALSGCTLAGAGAGALVGSARARANPDAHISIENHARVGVVIGLLADAAAIWWFIHREPPHFGNGGCAGCD